VNRKEAAIELLARKRARTNYISFCEYIDDVEKPAKHHKILCNALDKVLSGDIRNLMVFMPPGSAKSTYGTVRFPPYYLGRTNKKSILCCSYNEKLATSFGRKVRNLVNTKKCNNVFPDLTLTQDQKAKGEWETTSGSFYLATGVGGGVTGRRGDIGFIDDPVKGRKEADSPTVKQDTWDWYINDFLTRLKPGASQIIIQTRWSEDDLSGRILPDGWSGESGDIKCKDGKLWTVICISAECVKGKNDPLKRKPGELFWLEWFNKQYWAETKETANKSDSRTWNSLYQQNPASETGTFFKREWFNRYNIGDRPKHLTKFGAADYAVTDGGGDFTEQGVCGLDCNSDLYIIDWISCQSESDVWVDDVINLHKKYNLYMFGAEKGQIRRAIAPWLNRRQSEENTYFDIEEMPHIGDKAANARSFQAMAKVGKVYIPMTKWGNDLVDQLVKFPSGAFDDKVDVCGIMGRLIDQINDAIIPAQDKKAKDSWDRSWESQDDESWKVV